MPKGSTAGVVYIVDPDASVRQGLARLVDAAGLEARLCDSADAFEREPRGDRRACALVDVSDLVRGEPAPWSRLRAAAQTIPVIALSAADDAATRRMARELGAQAFFRKPVDAAALLDSIDWVMRAEAPGSPTDRR
jgi:FixJ family two-component response regulator